MSRGIFQSLDKIKTMIEAADKIVDFQETYPVYAEKYEATFGSPWDTA